MASPIKQILVKKLQILTNGYVLAGFLVHGCLVCSAVILAINAARVPNRGEFRRQVTTCRLFNNQGFPSEQTCLQVWCTNTAGWPQERCQAFGSFEDAGYDPDYNHHYLSDSFPFDEDSPRKSWISLALICAAAFVQAIVYAISCFRCKRSFRKRLTLKYKWISFLFSALGWMFIAVAAATAIIGAEKAAQSWGLYNTPIALWIASSVFSFTAGAVFFMSNILLMQGRHFMKDVQISSSLPAETHPLNVGAEFPKLASPPARACGPGMTDILFPSQGGYSLLPQWKRNLFSSQSTGTPISSSGTLSDQSLSPSKVVDVGGLPHFSEPTNSLRGTRQESQVFDLGSFPILDMQLPPRPTIGPPWTDPRDDRGFHPAPIRAEYFQTIRQKCRSLPVPLPKFADTGTTASAEADAALVVLPIMLNRIAHKRETVAYPLREFKLEELYVATEGFAPKNKLGEGGFGCVYRGQLPDGSLVAVKKLHSDLGPQRSTERTRSFKSEMEIISRVQHRNLVRLVGYGMDNHDQGMLAYEFMPNGSLHDRLHGMGNPLLTWPTRVKIAVGAARGLAYLHNDCSPKILHRDIKAMNILLDEDFNAKVADFGLARLVKDEVDHVSTRVMGTFGYLAPDYAFSGQLTEKSDVYSFGVVLLELLTARKPIEQNRNDGTLVNVVEWAWQKQNENADPRTLVDVRLYGNFSADGAERMWNCALCCIQPTAHRRPAMEQVLRMLSDCQEGSYLCRHYQNGSCSTTQRTQTSFGDCTCLSSVACDVPPLVEWVSKGSETVLGGKSSDEPETSGLGEMHGPVEGASQHALRNKEERSSCPSVLTANRPEKAAQVCVIESEKCGKFEAPLSSGQTLGIEPERRGSSTDRSDCRSRRDSTEENSCRDGRLEPVDDGKACAEDHDLTSRYPWRVQNDEEIEVAEDTYSVAEINDADSDGSGELLGEWGEAPTGGVISSPESVGTIFRGLLETAKGAMPGARQAADEDMMGSTQSGVHYAAEVNGGGSEESLCGSRSGSGRMAIYLEKRLNLTKLMQEEKYEEALSQLSSSGEWVAEETGSEVSRDLQGDEVSVSINGKFNRKRKGPGDGTSHSRLRETCSDEG